MGQVLEALLGRLGLAGTRLLSEVKVNARRGHQRVCSRSSPLTASWPVRRPLLLPAASRGDPPPLPEAPTLLILTLTLKAFHCSLPKARTHPRDNDALVGARHKAGISGLRRVEDVWRVVVAGQGVEDPVLLHHVHRVEARDRLEGVDGQEDGAFGMVAGQEREAKGGTFKCSSGRKERQGDFLVLESPGFRRREFVGSGQVRLSAPSQCTEVGVDLVLGET